MKTLRVLSGVLVCTLTVCGADKENRPADASLNLANLVRITPRPTLLRPNVLALCMPSPPPGGGTKSDHGILVGKSGAVAHVFVSPNAIDAMLTKASTTFPVGSVVLKQKFEDSNVQNVILYTGMLKREKGFNPECGDWEFFTLSGDGRTITSRGRLENCMACHKDYARGDFVTKEYPIER